jgi:tetratricopeptide (TPR) repeat protein
MNSENEKSAQLMFRADQLFDAESFRDALSAYEMACREVASLRVKASLTFSIGRCHEKLGDPHAAYDAFRNAFEIDPNNSTIDENRVRLARELGLIQEDL